MFLKIERNLPLASYSSLQLQVLCTENWEMYFTFYYSVLVTSCSNYELLSFKGFGTYFPIKIICNFYCSLRYNHQVIHKCSINCPEFRFKCTWSMYIYNVQWIGNYILPWSNIIKDMDDYNSFLFMVLKKCDFKNYFTVHYNIHFFILFTQVIFKYGSLFP